MDDPEVTDPIFKTTSKAGLETVAWLDAGTRNFYTIKTPINQPSDLKGLKIRVQQSPTNVEMMRLLGGTLRPWASEMCTPHCRPVFWMVPRTTSWL